MVVSNVCQVSECGVEVATEVSPLRDNSCRTTETALVVETIDGQELFYDYERGEHLVSCQPSRMTRSYLNNVRSILRVRYLIVRLYLIGNGKRYR